MTQHTTTETAANLNQAWQNYRKGVRNHAQGRTSFPSLRTLTSRTMSHQTWLHKWTELDSENIWRFDLWPDTCPDPNIMKAIVDKCNKKEWDLWVAYEWVYNTPTRTPKLPSPIMLDAGVTPQEFELLQTTGLYNKYRAVSGHKKTLSLIFALQGLWGSHHLTLRQARRWRMNGFLDPHEVTRWRSKGFSAAEAVLWRQAQLDVTDAVDDALLIAATQNMVAVDEDNDE